MQESLNHVSTLSNSSWIDHRKIIEKDSDNKKPRNNNAALFGVA